MQILTQEVWVGPERLHFYRLQSDTDAAGPWSTLGIARGEGSCGFL